MAAPNKRGRNSDILREDCRKLLSVICHEEVVRHKKMRWLEGSKLGKDDWVKFSDSRFLPEPLIRNDDVSFQRIKASLKSITTPKLHIQQSNHVVADYLELFDPCMASKPAIFVQTLSSALKYLKSDVLEQVARVVIGNSSICPATRAAMRRAVIGILPEMFFHSKGKGHFETIRLLSQVFRNPISFWKQMTIITPVTHSLLSSIGSIMQKLDDMPTQALTAMCRKFDGETVIPQLPIFIKCKKNPLINRLWSKYEELKLKNGDELPRPLAKALSVVSLTLKERERQTGMSSTEFFPFTREVVALQNDILMAIWSIPKVKIHELKMLRDMIDPNGELPLRTFRSAVLKYLLEYLYQCDEIDVPKSFLKLLSLINRKSRRQLDFVKSSSDDEVEEVINVSSQLKQVLWDSFPESTDQKVLDACMTLESEECEDTDDIEDDLIIDEDKNHLGFATEGMGDSEPADCSIDSTDFVGNTRSQVGSKDNQSFQLDSGHLVSLEHGSYNSIQSVCDDTSLLACRLVDHVLERLQMRGSEEPEWSDISSKLLVQSVEKLVLHFPKGGLDKAKNLMGIS